MNTTTKLNWRNLIVTDEEGACGTLGNIVDSSPANLDNADYTSRGIAEWPGFYLSEEGTEPSFEVPQNVDWAGFAEAMEQVTGLKIA